VKLGVNFGCNGEADLLDREGVARITTTINALVDDG